MAVRHAVEIVALAGPGNHPRLDDTDHAPVEAPPSQLVADGNGRSIWPVEGAEPGQGPVTIVDRDRHLWSWMCSWCAAGDGGYDQEHHARTVGDEHTRTHRWAELHGGSTALRVVAETPASIEMSPPPTNPRKDRAMPSRRLINREIPLRRDLSHLDTSWMERGACRGADPGLWFPDRTESALLVQARAVCESCPVRQECLDYALDANETHGMWGGKSERERRRMRRERKAS